jgi:hypothetical protein
MTSLLITSLKTEMCDKSIFKRKSATDGGFFAEELITKEKISGRKNRFFLLQRINFGDNSKFGNFYRRLRYDGTGQGAKKLNFFLKIFYLNYTLKNISSCRRLELNYFTNNKTTTYRGNCGRKK